SYNPGCLLVKFNPSGEIIWIKWSADTGISLILDHQGNPIVAGNRTVTTVEGWLQGRLSIIKHSALDGSIVWESVSASGSGLVQNTSLSPDGNIYISFAKGNSDYISCGGGSNCGFLSGARRNVILKTDQNGNPQWAKF